MTTYLWATGFESGSIEIFPVEDRLGMGVGGSSHSGSMGVANTGYGSCWFKIRACAGLSETYISLWIRPALDCSTFQVCALGNDNDVSIRLVNHYWNAYIGSTQVAQGSVYVPYGAWRNVALRVKIGGTGVGIIQTYIDGLQDINYTGDTQLGATSQLEYHEIVTASSSDSSVIDDIVIASDGWPGPVCFDGLRPSGDYATAWDPSTGSDNYSLVDETTPGDSDYIQTSVDAEQDLYDIADWDETNKLPQFVVHWTRAHKTDIQDASVKQLLRYSSSVHASPARVLSLTPQYFAQLDLGGSATNDIIDALQIGVESDL